MLISENMQSATKNVGKSIVIAARVCAHGRQGKQEVHAMLCVWGQWGVLGFNALIVHQVAQFRMAVITRLPKQQQPLLPQLPQQPQPQRLQLQLQLFLSPPDLAGDITVTVPPTPPLPALVEGIIVILHPQLLLLQLLPVNQEGGLRKMHQSAVVISKGNLVLEEVRYKDNHFI